MGLKLLQYKPRTQLGKCNICSQKNITAAYHTICSKCAGSDKAIAAMEKRGGGSQNTAVLSTTPTDAQSADDESSQSAAFNTNNNNDDSLSNKSSGEEKTASYNRRHMRVCAMCTLSPALSKYAHASPDDIDIIEQLNELEDTLESKTHPTDGHKLTLREIKGVERKIDKLQEELKLRKKKRAAQDEDPEENEEEERDGEGKDNESEESENEYDDDEKTKEGEELDPFLAATGGKALVGEEYQAMLLARLGEKQK